MSPSATTLTRGIAATALREPCSCQRGSSHWLGRVVGLCKATCGGRRSKNALLAGRFARHRSLREKLCAGSRLFCPTSIDCVSTSVASRIKRRFEPMTSLAMGSLRNERPHGSVQDQTDDPAHGLRNKAKRSLSPVPAPKCSSCVSPALGRARARNTPQAPRSDRSRRNRGSPSPEKPRS